MNSLADVAWIEPAAMAKTCADALAAADTSKAAPGAATRTVHAGGVNQDGEYNSRDITWRLTTTRMLDVDGDAILDAFVPNHGARQCPEEGTWDVYVVRGGGACGHALGTIGPGWFGLEAALVPLDRSGYRPLTTESEHAKHGARSPIPEMVTTTTVHKVKRKAYRVVSAKRRSGVCHHCAVWYCTTP